MSSLRLVHSKNWPLPTAEADPQTASSSARLEAMVTKLYGLEHHNQNGLQVFEDIIDDLLAEARGSESPNDTR
jgi:hypothetical protein